MNFASCALGALSALVISVPLPSFARTCADLFVAESGLREVESLGRIQWKRFEIRLRADSNASNAAPLSKRKVLVRTGIFESLSGPTKGLRLSFEYVRQIRRPATGPSVVLLHGVLNRRQDLAAFSAEFENRGWNVLNVDLLGHGDTAFLNRELQNLKRPIDHKSQVEILTSLTRQIHARFNLDRPIVVGHSLGGGLSMVLAKELGARGLEPRANVPIAPYLSAIDKFMSHHGLTPEVLRHFNDRLIEKLGLRVSEPGSFHSAYIEAWQSFFRIIFEPALIALESPQFRQFSEILHSVNEPYSKKVLENIYRRYQEFKDSNTPAESKLSDADMELLIQGAIASTQGVRSLNYQARRGATALDPNIPTLIISGEKDDVVIRPQIEDFRKVAQRAGYDVTFVEMKSDHHIPQRHPVELTDIVIGFLAERGLLPQ